MTILLASRALPGDLTEQAALEGALDDLVLSPTPDTALLVVTQDAGSATARAFYAQALALGPALASPAAFPWCLANAPAGTIARRFGFTGPNVTWMADDLAGPAAYTPLAAWLEGGDAPAVIAALRFGGQAARLLLWVWQPGDALPAGKALAQDWGAPTGFR